jgi:GntR family transcriptional regulator
MLFGVWLIVVILVAVLQMSGQMLGCASMAVNRSKPRYRSLADALQRDIRSGRYRVGSALPGELELVARHRVSRHTVREALRCLTELGLVTRNRGIGTVVCAREPATLHVQHLGSPAEWMRYPAGSRLEVRGIAEVQADAKLAGVLRCQPGSAWCQVSAVRRLAGRRGRIIGWSDIYLPPEYAAVALSVGKAGGYVYQAIEKQFGTRVAGVEVEIRADILPATPAVGIGVEPGTPSLAIIRRYLDAAARVFLVTVAEHPAERFTYAFRLQRSADGRAWIPA